MFSLKPTEAQADLDQQIRALGLEQLRRHGLAAERDRTIPAELADELDKLGRQIHTSPELADPVSALVALEALAFGDPGIAYALLPSFQVAQLIRACGSARHRETLLPRVADMWSTASSLLYYEGFGRGQTELQTEATPTEVTPTDDGWVVTGRKIAVHHPGVADVSVIIAREGTGGLAGFVSEGPPLRCRTESETWQAGALGAAVTSTGTVRLNGVRCPAARRLDSTDLHRAVGYARLMLAAVQVGAAEAAVDYAGRYAGERYTFGRPLVSYQGVSFVLVECETNVDSARLELCEAAQRLAELDEPAEIERLVGRAVRRASNVSTQVTREGIQLLGVHGIVTEHPVERFWRHASTLSLIDFDPLDTPLSLA
jgi:alkylation response protein AidB-like acyl-CoA dehydrogenase